METRPRTVFLLGAGFSLAVSDHMPLLAHLGLAISRRFREDDRLRRLLFADEETAIDAGLIPLGNVEVWLSALSVDQPFLTLSENLARRALAAELAVVIAHHVEQCQQAAMIDPMQRWLMRLVAAWHYSTSTVITLNYDTLVETAVMSLELKDRDDQRAMVADVLRGSPARRRRPLARRRPPG